MSLEHLAIDEEENIIAAFKEIEDQLIFIKTMKENYKINLIPASGLLKIKRR